jgi:N-acetylmuramoyl-L-alanine amidase
MRWISSFARASSLAFVVLWGAFPGAGPVAAQKSAATLYKDAQTAEKRLHKSETRLKKKSEWNNVAKLYRKVVLTHPQSGYCDDALYLEAEVHIGTYRRFADQAALQRGLDAYLLLANGYPSSKWAKRARLSRGKLMLESSDRKNASIELRKVAARWASSTEAAEARRLIENMSVSRRSASESLPPGMVGVRNIRHWSDSKREYTRVVIDLDKDIKYRQGQLQNPDRIYFDLIGTRVTKALAAKPFPVDGDFLKQIRVGQNKPDTVRVVLDFKSISDYNVFWLPDPYRLVVDISGEKPQPRVRAPEAVVAANTTPPAQAEPSGATPTPPPAAPPSTGAAATSPNVVVDLPPPPRSDGEHSLAQQLGLEARRVIIDPGHGGHDPGTMSKKGLREKDLVLDISTRVAKILEAQGFEVLMTRTQDVFIPLEERTAIANSRGADLFVSIHVNASRSSKPRGIETYYLNLATSPDAAEVAARENASTTRRLSELNDLLQKVMNNSKIEESRELATHVQTNMASELFDSPKDARNRGIKTAPFYVLLGARVPSVLVEVAYLSNQKDEELLKSAAYRKKIAESIAKGVGSYHGTLVRKTSVDTETRVAGQ